MRTPTAPRAVATLEDRLGHRFADPGLLQLALTHRSWCGDHGGSDSNERLEFLGDAVLGLVVAHRLYERFGHWSEGLMAKARASVVNASSLAEAGRRLGLGEQLRLSRGEDATGGRAKASVLSDALEALIGAVYLDGGLSAASGVVTRLFDDRMDAAARSPGHSDFKTRLQELAARLGVAPPAYDVTTSGPAHDPVFAADVRVGTAGGFGQGTTKKDAEQQAARVAYSALAADGSA